MRDCIRVPAPGGFLSATSGCTDAPEQPFTALVVPADSFGGCSSAHSSFAAEATSARYSPADDCIGQSASANSQCGLAQGSAGHSHIYSSPASMPESH